MNKLILYIVAFLIGVILYKLLNDKELASKLGNNARELLLEKFNWDVVAKKFLVAAESVLQKRVK